MPRMPRLTDALRGRGKALAYLGAAAALASAGAGTAAAATSAPAARPAALSPAAHAAALTGHSAPASLAGHTTSTGTTGGGTGGSTGAGQASAAAVTHTAAPQPARTSAPAPASQQASQPGSQPTAAQVARQDQQAAGGQLNQAGNYQIYDSVTPSQIPAGHPVATYADGGYAVQPGQVTGKQVLWIDTNGTDPARAAVLDVEPGDATPAQAATWVQQRETAHPGQLAVVYTMLSDWGAAQQAIHALPHAMQANVRWWIADPTGTPHIVPGATATQWYWGPNYDISNANGTL